MKEKTYLGHDGIFVTEEEYSEFVRTEIVVNAAAHRDYGIKGTDIQIKMFDDRLEVDSPGTFAGMVRKENIRYTHFSRNPKIAAFLKDYGYVKEYGEGVDRMCRELEAIGLPDPCFNNDKFILKTMVKSAAFDHESTQNMPVATEKNADSAENMPINAEKVAGSTGRQNSTFLKLSFESFEAAYQQRGYNEPTIQSLNRLFGEIAANQVFSSTYLVKVLGCAERTARNIMKKLREMDVVVPVSGKGKGMYRLKYKSET